MISTPAGEALTSISICLSSRSPSRSFLRNFCRVLFSSRLDHGRAAGAEVSAAARRWQQHIENTLLGGILGAISHSVHLALAGLLQGHVRQIANDRFDIAPDIADLGELGGLDLDERGLGELGQPPGDLGLADAGGADHQDVLRRDLVAQRVGHLHASPAIAQGDRHRTLGVVLPDDVLVELLHDFTGGHLGHDQALVCRVSMVRLPLV